MCLRFEQISRNGHILTVCRIKYAIVERISHSQAMLSVELGVPLITPIPLFPPYGA